MSQPEKVNNSMPADLESKLWQAADKLRGHVDPAEYKNVVLGLIFLKYISDAFQALYDRLVDDEYADPEDRDEYLAENIFFVPEAARWQNLQDNAKQPTIGNPISTLAELRDVLLSKLISGTWNRAKV